ncbi:type II toxin-antitoxin system PemK/MazF family toxin [Cellulosimicrobium terreum]|nr:type II toxin-antitoxin system PemK/MazF family toxin [Cellulosimicrobium terreum]
MPQALPHPGQIKQGQIVWLSMDPTQGHEQAKHRPHMVLSQPPTHQVTHIITAVPLTHTDRGWPMHVEWSKGSFAMCEQVRSFAYERITKVDPGANDVTPIFRTLDLLWGRATS